MRLILAGSAGTGKTTTAKIVAKKTGAKYVEIEARECWPLQEPFPRQKCFTQFFAIELLYTIELEDSFVADNSLLSVYGYSIAFGKATGQLLGLIKSLVQIETAKAKTILLTASADTIEERIKRRLKEEPLRKTNRLLEDLVLIHKRAQEAMRELAGKLGIPIVDTTNKNPEQVAEEIIKLTQDDQDL